jgi:hypothetical protein
MNLFGSKSGNSVKFVTSNDLMSVKSVPEPSIQQLREELARIENLSITNKGQKVFHHRGRPKNCRTPTLQMCSVFSRLPEKNYYATLSVGNNLLEQNNYFAQFKRNFV